MPPQPESLGSQPFTSQDQETYPPVVDSVTDALAAAIYHVLEQLDQKVSDLGRRNGKRMKVTMKLVSESGVEQEVVVLSDQPVLAALEEPIEKMGNFKSMKLVFDGRTVLLGETPESLGMEDGDMVEVVASSGERPLSQDLVRRAVNEAITANAALHPDLVVHGAQDN